MTALSGGPGRTIATSWSLFLAIAFLYLGNGLLGTLLGVRSELEGFATTATGIIMASYFAGILFGSQMAPAAVGKVGHVRVFAGLASLASSAVLVHAIIVTPGVWIAMRFVSGFCQAGILIVAESWINEQATNENRGRLLSAYMITVMGSLGLGQLLLSTAEPTGFQLFVVASVLVSLAVVPISLAVGGAPTLEAAPPLSIRVLWRDAPLGIVGGLGTGLANAAVLGMAAVFATRVGMSPTRVALFVAATMLGSVVLQWPIGAFSDRVPRRRVLLLVTMLAAGAAALATQLPYDGVAIIGVMFVFGGLTFPMYSLSLGHINDVLPRGQAIAASSIFVFIIGVGAVAGPLAAAVAMDLIGPVGFFWTLAAAHGLIGVFAAYRIAVHDAPPTDQQRPYRPFPARASAVIHRLGRPRRTTKKD